MTRIIVLRHIFFLQGSDCENLINFIVGSYWCSLWSCAVAPFLVLRLVHRTMADENVSERFSIVPAADDAHYECLFSRVFLRHTGS